MGKCSASTDRSTLQGSDPRAFFDGLATDQSVEKSDTKRISGACRIFAAARDSESGSFDKTVIAEQERAVLAKCDTYNPRSETMLEFTKRGSFFERAKKFGRKV